MDWRSRLDENLMRKAAFFETVAGQSVVCNLCEHRCLIRPGRVGICRVRKNLGGVLYTQVYDRVVSLHVDPIEKKPLFHFLPGTRSFSIATVGCNFHCLFCQNWQISQLPKDLNGFFVGREITPEELVHEALRTKSATIAYTYTEPTIFFELSYDTARLATNRGLKNIFVTNGYLTPEALGTISPYLHAANVDLKGFDDRRYRRICGAKLEPVLETIRLMRELGIWIEVTTLVVPGFNDSEGELRQIARFLKGIGEEIPWHLSAFYPAYKMHQATPTDPGSLERAWQIGKEEGLRYVYCGNLPGNLHESTECYQCGKPIVERWGFNVGSISIQRGFCLHCQARIDGVWNETEKPLMAQEPSMASQ
jgi:pyruvate formate lyase activating enzyme